MSKRIAAALLATLALAACSNGGTATQNAPTFPVATAAATAAASTGTGGTDADPNTIAGFCQMMTATIAANWPPKDAAAATTISPLLRNWAQIAAFKDIAGALLAVSDWTASMSIMSTVPAPPADVASSYAQITAFASSHCG